MEFLWNWSIIDEVTTRNTTAYFFGPLCINDISTFSLDFVNSAHNVALLKA